MNIQNWIQQPTTISGIEKLAMGLVGAAGLYANGNHAAAIVAGSAGLAGGLVGMLMPDNTKASADTQAAVASFVTDIQGKNQQAATADALNGAVKVLSDIAAKMAPAPVVTPAVVVPVATPPAP